MAGDDRSNKSGAELKKLQQAESGRKAMLDYEKDAAATRAKTERLKALRLARDAAEPAVPAKASSSKKSGKTPKRKPAPLSEWLSDQKKDGLRD